MRICLLSLLPLALSCAGSAAPSPDAPSDGQTQAANSVRAPTRGAPVSLPVEYDEDRFIVVPRTAGGQTLALFTDTGGGLFISRAAAERLRLPLSQVKGDSGRSLEAALLPAFAPEASIPTLEAFGGRLPVWNGDQKAPRLDRTSEGMLGQSWFRDRVWTFDYPGRKLWWRAAGDLPHASGHRVSLGFRTDAQGERENDFPRIPIQVGGQTIQLLFDTGATVVLSRPALAAMGDGRPAARATSFIVASIFDRWRREHPDWRVIEKADMNAGGEPMIEVPEIEVGGFSVGPVWFTRRADPNFHEFMSSMMDRRVDGALGGSALRHFRVTVDYPHAVAVFERTSAVDSPLSAPSLRGLDRAALAALLARARESGSDAVVIYKDGQLAGQWYFGRPQGPIEAMSATKSIVSLAIGRLVHTGKIRSLDQPVADFFPEWRQGMKRKVTIRHLLSHTSGMQNEINTTVEIYPSRDFVQLALAAELTAEPGTAFAYNNKAVNLLAGIIRVASGRRMDEYVRGEIFAPLGITDFTWTLDPAGNPHAMSGLQIRAVDLARIGQLMLQGGRWQGKTIVPASWVRESTAASQRFEPRCGLLWWRAGDFPRLVADSQLIAAWRKGGVDEKLIARVKPLAGVTFRSRKEAGAALAKALGGAAAAWDASTWQRGLPAGKNLPGPAHGFMALGYLGQQLVVIPKHQLVAVRQMRGRDDVDPDTLDSFEEFPDMVRALVAR